MNKYKIKLASNWDRKEPFIAEWDYEMIGDNLRAKFDVYFAEQEKLAGASMGGTKQLFKGEYVKKFMIHEKINLTDNPANGNLRSVFVLKPGEEKTIDERAKKSLAPRFEYKEKILKDGTKTHTDGFILFTPFEGNTIDASEVKETLQISGNDIEYFEEEEKVEEPESIEIKVETFSCEKCGKEFDSAAKLRGHKMSCKA